jgi:hypothetical protein
MKSFKNHHFRWIREIIESWNCYNNIIVISSFWSNDIFKNQTIDILSALILNIGYIPWIKCSHQSLICMGTLQKTADFGNLFENWILNLIHILMISTVLKKQTELSKNEQILKNQTKLWKCELLPVQNN